MKPTSQSSAERSDPIVLPREVTASGHTVQAEPYDKNMAHEINPLYLLHWDETEAPYRGGERLASHYTYIQASERGSLLLVTIRRPDGALCGYLMFSITRDAHRAGTFRANEIGIWLHPDDRKGLNGSRLFSYGERCLKELGCSAIAATCKSPVGGPRFGVILKRQGYRHIANLYAKEL